MDYNSLSLKMHEENKGKVEVISKVKVKDRDDLSTAYTPGVAEPCRKIRKQGTANSPHLLVGKDAAAPKSQSNIQNGNRNDE